jgi:uncharacterized protein (DUF934 family)
MPLIKDGAAQADSWTYLGPSDDPADGQSVIIDYARWHDADAAIAAHNGPLGIRMRSDQAPELIAEDIGRFDLIALEFPVIADGRSFSHARILRDRLGFQGELRAAGGVLEDQIFFMSRCGIDAFELDAGCDIGRAVAALTQFSAPYQAASDGLAPAPARRRSGR